MNKLIYNLYESNPELYFKLIQLDFPIFVQESKNFFYDYPEYQNALNEKEIIKNNFDNFFNNFLNNYEPKTYETDMYVIQLLKYCQRELLKSCFKFSYKSFLDAKISHK